VKLEKPEKPNLISNINFRPVQKKPQTELGGNVHKSEFGYSKVNKKKKDTKVSIKLDPSPEKSNERASDQSSNCG
jgi:hypothetical protein